jgi:hypothetical protein
MEARFTMKRFLALILASLPLATLCGCGDDELIRAARQAAEQQRQLVQMQAEVARGASQLVEADAKARAELLTD